MKMDELIDVYQCKLRETLILERSHYEILLRQKDAEIERLRLDNEELIGQLQRMVQNNKSSNNSPRPSSKMMASDAYTISSPGLSRVEAYGNLSPRFSSRSRLEKEKHADLVNEINRNLSSTEQRQRVSDPYSYSMSDSMISSRSSILRGSSRSPSPCRSLSPQRTSSPKQTSFPKSPSRATAKTISPLRYKTTPPGHVNHRDFFHKTKRELGEDKYGKLLKLMKQFNKYELSESDLFSQAEAYFGLEHADLFEDFSKIVKGETN